MRTNIARIQAIIRAIHKDGPTDVHLKQAVILLCDEVIYLERELDSVKTIAQRAERNARMMGVLR
jgi:hypothetical protein